MRFKHSVSLTCDQFANVFKLFFYRIVTSLVFYSLIYLILRQGVSFILKSEELATLRSQFSGFLHAITLSAIDNDPTAVQEFQLTFHSALMDFFALLGNHIGTIIGSVIGVAIMYILQRFVNGIANFAIGSLVSDRMSVHSRTRFAVAYFRNIARAALYYLFYVPVAFVYDLLSVVACWFLFFYIPSLLPNWGVLSLLAAVAFTMTALICLQALKLTLVSSWMPAMIADGKSLRGALRETAQIKKDFWRRLSGFIVACYVIVVMNVVFAACTAGSGLLLTVPLSFMFLIVLQFVNYYESNGKKYFLAKNVIWEGDEDEPELVGDKIITIEEKPATAEEEISDRSEES